MRGGAEGTAGEVVAVIAIGREGEETETTGIGTRTKAIGIEGHPQIRCKYMYNNYLENVYIPREIMIENYLVILRQLGIVFKTCCFVV